MLKRDIIDFLELSDSEKKILKVLEGYSMARRVAAIARLAGTPRTTTIHTLKKLTRYKLAIAIDCRTHVRWRYNRSLR